MNKLRVLYTFIYYRWLLRFIDGKDLKKYQRKHIYKQIQYMKIHSPYYRKYSSKKLPLMNKEKMMKHFDSLNTVGISKEEVLKLALMGEKTRDFSKEYQGISVGLSSGTSGHRGIFITTKREQELWAGVVLAKLLPKNHLLGHRIAFFLRADNNMYHAVNSFVIKFSYFDTFKDIEEHIIRLNQYQPSILVAPASMLIALAKRVGELKISPMKIISVAEILEDRDKEFIKAAFRQEIIHQVYQATEGFLACTCEYGNLHLNEDVVYIKKKYIDQDRFYPIITDLYRSSQPMIYYELNDILVEDKRPCACGSIFTRLKAIEGRADDIFLFLNQKGKEIIVYPDFIRRCILFVDGIREYRVIQEEYQKICILIDDLDIERREKIQREFQILAMQKGSLPIQIEFKEYIQDSNIKLKRIMRNFKRRSKDV